MSTETYEQTFSVSGIPTVEVGNIRGKIEVSPGETGQVHVTAIKQVTDGNPDRTEVKLYQNEEGHVIVETQYRDGISGWLGFLHQHTKIEYTVVVPRECNLTVNSVSGEAQVRGLEGELNIRSVSGAMTAEDISGKLKLNTVSGKVEGKRLSGPLILDSVSGSVNLSESNLPSLKANTVSGSLTVETPLGEGPYWASSVSGSLTLIVPEHSSCTADISSVSGRIHTNLPNAEKWKDNSPGRRHHRIKLGKGGPEIKLNSVSGVLRVMTPDWVTPQNLPAVTQNPAPSISPTRMDILNRIALGELTPNEGLSLLHPA